MNLFVTGGTGYPGWAVTAALRADGHTVRAHVRSIAPVDRLPAEAEPVAGDLGDAASLRARTGESDGAVHAASPNDATSGSFDAAFLDVALCALAGSDRPLVYTGGPEPALLYAGNGKRRCANVHRDAIATLYALGVRTAPAGSYYLGANAHSPTMTEFATAASRSRGLNGPIAAEPEADSRARLGLSFATFMLLLDITVLNTALPSILGEES